MLSIGNFIRRLVETLVSPSVESRWLVRDKYHRGGKSNDRIALAAFSNLTEPQL